MILSAPDPALDRAYAAALLRLQHDAYRSQAELIGDDRLFALAADDDSLPSWRGRYLVAWEGTNLVAAVAWRNDGGEVDLDRLMVDPAAHRRGVATQMLTALISLLGARTIRTYTATHNSPGLALYQRFGFEPYAEDTTPTGIRVTRLKRS